MSHKAVNWAFQQRGVKPGAKLVLLQLADCHNPDFGGTFPSRSFLSRETEIPLSTLDRYLQELEQCGLIARETRRKPGNGRQERTRYYFPFEPRFSQFCSNFPSPDLRTGTAEAESQIEGEPSPKNAESRVPNWESNPVREPVSESVKEEDARETLHHDGASEFDAEENSKSHERRVKALEIGRHNNPWPGALGRSTQWAVSQFAKLLPAERLIAEERRDDYLAACGGKPVSLGMYLKDRKFLDIAPRQAPSGSTAPGMVRAAIFGSTWCVARMIALLRGPGAVVLPENIRQLVKDTYLVRARSSIEGARQYAHGKNILIKDDGSLVFPADFEKQELLRRRITEGFPEVNRLHDPAKSPMAVDARFARLKDYCEAVPIGSSVWDEWRQWHESWVFPWVPETGSMKVVWFPAGGPGAIRNFEQHAKEVFNGRD